MFEPGFDTPKYEELMKDFLFYFFKKKQYGVQVH